MSNDVSGPSGEEIAVKRLEVTNLIYDFINDTSLMPNLIDGLAELDAIDPASDAIFAKLDNAAELAQKIHSTPDVDITRDIGLLVVGLNAGNVIALVPPGADEWLGQKFKPSSEGMAWLLDRSGARCLAHYIDFGARNHLPVDQSLIDGLRNEAISTLIVIYRFDLTDPAQNALQELYGLTSAELWLCNCLGRGLTLKEAAAEKGIGVETVRTHLKRAFHKMGINRQTELVRIVTQISAAASVYDVSRRHELALLPDHTNSIRTSHTAFMRTRRGKKLSYSCYGHPNGEPWLFFHHTLGCRILTEEMVQAAYDAGILLYTFDRPGYGDTELIEGYCAKDLAELTEDFLDAHGIESVRAIALAISGRIVLEAIPHMQGRLKSLDLYSFRGTSPPNDPKHIWNHFIYLVIKNARHVAPMVRLLKAAFTPNSLVKNLQSAYGSSPADQQVVASPKNCFYLINVLQLANKQHGIGPSAEFANLREPFDPDPADYSQTWIRAFFGSDDKFNPYEDAKELLAKLPQIEVNHIQDAGQLYLFARLGEFLTNIRQGTLPTEDITNEVVMEVLLEELKSRGLSLAAWEDAIGIPQGQISEVL